MMQNPNPPAPGIAGSVLGPMSEITGRAFGAASRLVHNPAGAVPSLPPAGDLAEQAALSRLDRDLAAGRLLRSWWEATGSSGRLARRFELERAFNLPVSAYGFFDEVRTPSGPLPIMGVAQEMFYDHPKFHRDRSESVAATCRQVREFVLRYFMRVSSFREPQARAVASGAHPVPSEGPLNWCPDTSAEWRGFGFSQHFARMRASGQIARFRDEDRYAIVDQRDLGRTYDWILARVKIYDFSVRLRVFDPPAPELVFTIDEESYLAMAPDFVRDVERPEPGVAAEYGVGYAYVRNDRPGALAYGPGEFDAAFKQIVFRVLDSGEIRVRMIFISNLPTGVINIRLDPVAAAFRAADVLSFGLSSMVFGGLERAARALSGNTPSFDPVYAYIALVNGLTNGRAEDFWCASREQLNMEFLVQHFRVHYRALTGSLATWRLIPDWLDERRLPEWIVRGVSP